MLFETPALDAADHAVLDEIDRLRDELRHHVAEPRRWLGQLRRSLTAGAIRGSNTIEGYTIGDEDAEALVAGDEMSSQPDETTRAAVEGYRDALTYVQQSAHFEVFAYDVGLLSALHFMMLRHELAMWPGRYRASGIGVTGGRGLPPVYTGPAPELVPGLMDELVAWLNEGDLDVPVLVRAAIAHLDLVSIHPWRDGNGRMARCLQTLVLARDKVLAPEFSSIEEWLGMDVYNTGQYYAALQTTRETYDPKADTRHWVRFCLRVHHLQAQLVRRRLESAAELWERLAGIAARHGLYDRTIAALYAAAVGHLSRRSYQVDEGLTRDQAVRDLQALRRPGLIEPVGQGRTQRYTAGNEVRRVANEVRTAVESAPLRDPYRH